MSILENLFLLRNDLCLLQLTLAVIPGILIKGSAIIRLEHAANRKGQANPFLDFTINMVPGSIYNMSSVDGYCLWPLAGGHVSSLPMVVRQSYIVSVATEVSM